MRFGDEETDDPLPAIVDSIARSAYLPSLTHLASALDPRARSRHRPADARPVIAHDIPRVLAGALAHREAAPRKPRRRSSGGATAGAGQAPATMNSSAALR